jgi:lipoate-protein ligase A
VPGWEVLELTGSPEQIHAWEPARYGRRVTICRPSSSALVLGSTQDAGSIDQGRLEDLGLPWVRRRSGGGAVLVRPGGVLWVSVDLPAGDPLWEDDLGRSFLWLGHAWARALMAAGAAGARPHEEEPIRTEWSPVVCFAGLGPGEVRVDGRKAVGLAQRRRRQGATFHCAALIEWDPVEMASLATGAPDWLAEALDQFAGPCGVPPGVLLAELRRELEAT